MPELLHENATIGPRGKRIVVALAVVGFVLSALMGVALTVA